MSYLNPVTVTTTRPEGMKVSDGWSVIGIVAANSPALDAGELVALPLIAAGSQYFVGTTFEAVPVNAIASQEVVLNIDPAVIETKKFADIANFTVGIPVWYDYVANRLVATKNANCVYAGVVTEVLAASVRFILVRQPNAPYQMQTPITPAAAIADITDTGKTAVADVAGAALADLVTDINKVGGIKDVLNALLAKVDDANGVNVKINAIIAALENAGIILS